MHLVHEKLATCCLESVVEEYTLFINIVGYIDFHSERVESSDLQYRKCFIRKCCVDLLSVVVSFTWFVTYESHGVWRIF